ncbi:uncharacterized protein LOC143180197 [Calliopsis andreniformis]|uniref:uncharacterized protein LOC143180197 n=1 Tax=Calliopsis andreniformis TaxID=337506 RepID=UPI003FCCB9A7
MIETTFSIVLNRLLPHSRGTNVAQYIFIPKTPPKYGSISARPFAGRWPLYDTMNERFRFNCVQILILSILLHSLLPHCASEFLKDSSSNVDVSDFAEDLHNSLDPSIEKIFRASKDQKNAATDLQHSPKAETKFYTPSEEREQRIRVKRENTKRSVAKSGAEKSDEKRSASSKTSSRVDRFSRDLPKLSSKDSSDYEVPVDQDRSEYADEVEDETAANAENKESKYKSGEFRVGEDSERFIDQEERSSLYDDFEAKDVVKRGISGSEDYEEANEDPGEVAEDTAAVEERESLDEQTEKRKAHADTRVKREKSEGSKGPQNSEITGKEENLGASSDSSKDADAALKDAKKEMAVAEDQKNKGDKDVSEQAEESKRNVAEKQEKDESKVNPDAPKSLIEPQEAERNVNAKSLNEEGQEVVVDGKPQEESSLSNDKRASSESASFEGAPKQEEPKIVADIANPESTKVEVPMNGAGAPAPESTGKLESSGNPEAATGEQTDAEYEKRMEEQIQRKIDSIKEQIKREIAENQKMKDIRENNAKFDELFDEENEDQEQALQPEPSEKKENLSKRSTKSSGKLQVRENAGKRSVKRRKRQDDSNQGKLRSSEANLNAAKKTNRGATRKRSASKLEQPSLPAKMVPKREYPRQVFLMRHERNAGKKRRRRRTKNFMLVPEQGTVKLEDNLPPDVSLDSSLQGSLKNSKVILKDRIKFLKSCYLQSGSSLRTAEDEKAIADQSSLSERKSGSIASLVGNEELGPLATEYGEAFGGLNGEPGVALARFKRIKRVLRPSASKS